MTSYIGRHELRTSHFVLLIITEIVNWNFNIGCVSDDCPHKTWVHYALGTIYGCTKTNDDEGPWCPTQDGVDKNLIYTYTTDEGLWNYCKCKNGKIQVRYM